MIIFQIYDGLIIYTHVAMSIFLYFCSTYKDHHGTLDCLWTAIIWPFFISFVILNLFIDGEIR